MKLNKIGKNNNTMTMMSNFTATKGLSDAYGSRQKPTRVMLLSQLKSGSTSGIQSYDTSQNIQKLPVTEKNTEKKSRESEMISFSAAMLPPKGITDLRAYEHLKTQELSVNSETNANIKQRSYH